MKILFISGRERGYARNDVILRALQRFASVDWVAVDHRPKSLAMNSAQIALRALPRLIRRDYDLVFVGFYGHFLMLMPLRWLSHRPIVFDALLSTYDTMIDDRGAFKRESLEAKLARWLDRAACLRADHVLLDTPRHIDYFVHEYGLKPENFSAIPVGCNEELFFPHYENEHRLRKTVVYYSSYLPLHGVDVVVRAADCLQAAPIDFRLIGRGQNYSMVRSLAEELDLKRVEFIPEVPIEKIAAEIQSADLCLGGHFGSTAKAARVVPGKIYQILAMAKPLIATNTPANLELLTHERDAYLCRPGDPESLAQAILKLCSDQPTRERIAQEGYRLYQDRCSEQVITELLRQIVSGLVSEI